MTNVKLMFAAMLVAALGIGAGSPAFAKPKRDRYMDCVVAHVNSGMPNDDETREMCCELEGGAWVVIYNSDGSAKDSFCDFGDEGTSSGPRGTSGRAGEPDGRNDRGTQTGGTKSPRTESNTQMTTTSG